MPKECLKIEMTGSRLDRDCSSFNRGLRIWGKGMIQKLQVSYAQKADGVAVAVGDGRTGSSSECW